METSAWSLALVLCKWLMYVGQASAVGGVFTTLWIRSAALDEAETSHYRNPVVAGCLLGLLASAFGFFLQVGAFTENGLSGMFDAGMISLLWETPVGTSTVYRIVGVIVLLLTFLVATSSLAVSLKSTGLWVALSTSYLIGTGITGLSFNLVGHTAETGLVTRLLASLHVLAVLWWIGSLYPLWLSCRTHHLHKLQSLMHHFGRAAIAVVLLLIGAGVILILQLVGSVQAMIGTPYGLSLCAKLMLVAVILLLAAHHKWRLVPELVTASSAQTLSRSIAWEATIAIAILLVTAILSTVLGPETIK